MKRRIAAALLALILCAGVPLLSLAEQNIGSYGEADPVPVTNGEILIAPGYACVCPLSVAVSGEDAYYVYLQYVGAPAYTTVDRSPAPGAGGGDDIAFYIAPGETVELEVPIGDYKLFYACGETWYGLSSKFGRDTHYATSDDLLSFYASEQYYEGHSLQLWVQVGGNLGTEDIPADEFPG